jgi:hypothetical protein
MGATSLLNVTDAPPFFVSLALADFTMIRHEARKRQRAIEARILFI